MKKWLNKIIPLGITAILVWSCEKDEERVVFNIGSSPTLTSTATTLVLDRANANNNAVTFTWTAATFGFDAAITYEMQISKGGTNFASSTTTPVPLSNTAFTKTFKVSDFNKELLKIIAYGAATPVEVRVKASVGASATPAYSNVINMTVTAYRDIILYSWPQAINIAGNYQGWNPGIAPQIVNTNNGGYTNPAGTKYEGYINFTDANPQFKMVKGDNWGAGDFGSAGPGMLGNGGPNLTLSNGAGIYRIRADISAMTWTNTKITTWGLIGSATPGGWGSDQDMVLDPATGTWSITVNLVAGEMKFRANDDWGINFGDNPPQGSTQPDGKPEYDGANIPVAAAGNYTIKLEIGVGGNYAYSVKKN